MSQLIAGCLNENLYSQTDHPQQSLFTNWIIHSNLFSQTESYTAISFHKLNHTQQSLFTNWIIHSKGEMETHVTLPQCNRINYLKSSMAPPLDILFSLLLCLLLLCHSTVAFQQSVDLKNKHRTSVILTVSFQQSAGLKNKQNFSDSNTSNSQWVCDTGINLCPDTGHSFCQCQSCILFFIFLTHLALLR